MKKVNIVLPVFPGFYNTIFDVDSDMQDSELEKINEEREAAGLPVVSDNECTLKYKQYQTDVAKLCCDYIHNEFMTRGFVSSLLFSSLWSPKEYNYVNDEILCDVILTKKNEETIKAYIRERSNSFSHYLHKHFTTRSGFIPNSQISTDFGVWDANMDEYVHADLFLRIMFDFICENKSEEINEANMYYHVAGKVYLEFEFNNVETE